MPRPRQRAHHCALARIQSLSPNLITHFWEMESFSVDRKKKKSEVEAVSVTCVPAESLFTRL